MPTSPIIIAFDSNAEEQATDVETHGFGGIVCQEREIVLKKGASSLVDTYSGPWSDLEAFAFDLDASRPDITIRGRTFSFSEARIKSRRKGLRGELAASYVGTSTYDATQENPELDEFWEVESIQVTSAIQAAKPLAAYADQITQWMMADPELKREWKFKDGNNEVLLSGHGLAAAKLIAAGTTGFLQFYPVLRKITKLKGGKKYYVKIRTYKIVGGKKYYSPWSKTKTVRTKR